MLDVIRALSTTKTTVKSRMPKSDGNRNITYAMLIGQFRSQFNAGFIAVTIGQIQCPDNRTLSKLMLYSYTSVFDLQLIVGFCNMMKYNTPQYTVTDLRYETSRTNWSVEWMNVVAAFSVCAVLLTVLFTCWVCCDIICILILSRCCCQHTETRETTKIVVTIASRMSRQMTTTITCHLLKVVSKLTFLVTVLWL